MVLASGGTVTSVPVAVEVTVEVIGASVAVIGGAMITVLLGVVVAPASVVVAVAVLVAATVGVVVSTIVAAEAVVVGAVVVPGSDEEVAGASVDVDSDGGSGGVGGAVFVSLEVGTVLTVSVVSANATFKSRVLKSHEVLVASGAVVVGVVVVVVVADAAGTVPVAVLVAVPSSVVVASPGIFHTSVKPTFFTSPSVL